MSLSDKERAFQQKEQREQNAIQWYENNKYQIAKILIKKNRYSKYDNIIKSANTKYVVEIKVRTEYSSEQIYGWGAQFLNKRNLKVY